MLVQCRTDMFGVIFSVIFFFFCAVIECTTLIYQKRMVLNLICAVCECLFVILCAVNEEQEKIFIVHMTHSIICVVRELVYLIFCAVLS